MLNTIFPSSESSFSVALGRSDCVKYGLAAITDNHMVQSALMVQFIQPHKFLDALASLRPRLESD